MASTKALAARSLQSWIDSITQQDDPRVGSGREGSDNKGTLSAANGNKGASLSKLGSTFVPVIVYVAVCLIIFFIGRRRLRRVYSPRTLAALRAPEEPTPALPGGWFNWIIPFFKTPDTFVLNHGSLDGFFFLRFLKVLRNICFAGCLLTWPILLPLHATGGRGKVELEKLTIGNVDNPNRLYANVVVAWLLFGFVLFTVARENIYYINMRQAYLSSPYYSQRLSSRTVLFTSVPQRYLDEARLRKLYGDSVKRIWLPRTSKHLVNLLKEREQTAMRLEKAEIALIRKANAVRDKQLRKNAKSANEKVLATETAPGAKEEAGSNPQPSNEEVRPSADTDDAIEESSAGRDSGMHTLQGVVTDADTNADTKAEDTDEARYTHPYGLNPNMSDVRGSVAAQYLPAEARPYHRPIGNYFRRIDTIRWTRRRLIELNRDVAQIRKRLRGPNCDASDMMSAAFIEFDTQEAAQAAHQSLAHQLPLHMAPRLLGVRPDEIVWDVLRMPWWSRIIRRFAIMGFIVAGIIFWSIPSAFVGVISNVQTLTLMAPWLGWIMELPKPILGLLTGFAPALILSMFMALVPGMLRACARAAAVPTSNMVELFTQTAYFAFQVVQVFLVTTLTSAASAAFFGILENPLKAKDVLAQNLPLASNFYISYILIQCLANAGTSILQPIDLLRHGILGRIAQIPRAHYRLWRTMRRTAWGRDYPVFTNLGVIAMAYACIAPVILAFAALGMAFNYIVWRYNLIYVLDSDLDSKGLYYPRALNHLVVGLYLAELCLTGMFFLNSATGPGVLMAMLLVLTGLIHLSINQAISPLLQNLPQTLKLEEEIQEEERQKAEAARAQREDPSVAVNGAAASYFDEDEHFGDEDEDLAGHSDDDEVHEPSGTRAMEGSRTVRDTVGTFLKNYTNFKLNKEAQSMGFNLERDPDAKPNIVTRWLNPHIHEDFIAIRKHLLTLPQELPEAGDDPRRSYHPPEMWTPKPILWIPEDDACVSRQEVAHTRKSTPISDQGARLEGGGRVRVEVEKAPFWQPRLIL
ncbi:DUF221 domain-containing protein [Emericellopsis atlantica]|uniref:DUF221 domain-containing protein n=1 Tax=Emericellopsis atlantica TaxID=2614577 RepID=A0A9P7ZNF3_9HYPO|nr:DUF221 domain-containing protein [Emericellopsis atlantica]KAG9254765.1 DUF221 domain-containing protein [Emericellopsis atlantica]